MTVGPATPDTVTMFAEPSASLYWPPDVARHSMEALVFASSGWLRTACIVSALFWVVFRAYQVLTQPIEKLVQVLGLEVPVAPVVSLAGIKADGVLLHWKPPDQRASVLKYVIRINGIDIGDISPQETSITIENLQPCRHYTIRIVTLNSSSFQAPSVPIRLRTLAAASDHFYSPNPLKDATPATADGDFTPTPIIRPNKSLADVAPTVVAAPMTREHSNSTSRLRRPDIGRKGSPASNSLDTGRSAQDVAEGTDSIRQLTEKLDCLRRELDDMERQIQDEDHEFATQKTILADKRDEKKAALKEKEDASRDLRKEVASLERQNAAVQTKRAQQEKLLRQKEAERKKLKDDIAKWTREAGELRGAAERIKEERVAYETASERRIQALQDTLGEETQANRFLEEAIREKGVHIKALEDERRKLEEGQEGGEAPDGTDNADREEDNRWKMTLALLQQHYAQAWTLFTEAETVNREAANRLTYMQQRRMSQPQLFSGPPVPDMGPIRRNSQRARPLSMREGLLSAATGGFVHTSSAPFNSISATSSPSFASATPYFNPVNGMAFPSPRTYSTFSQADMESLTGGAPMSPTAGALLPAGLFGDDLGLTEDEDEHDPGPPRPPSLDPSPNLRNVLPGLGDPSTLNRIQDSSLPASPQSRSPSAFASPRESTNELQFYPNNENNMDSDRRSIRSTSSSFQINPQASRFGGLFGLNRARGKTFSDEGPALGSLKHSQSQSLPRQEHGLDASGNPRRRGSHSEGAWYDTFIRTKTQPVDSSSNPKHVATRKRPFNMFGGTKGDPWLTSVLGFDRPSSPRQGSTNSGEGMALPRPSTESQTRFGWNVDAFGARGSPLGVDWSINNTSTNSWSRMQSRRPSIQHGSTANLISEGIPHDDVLDFPSNTRSPTQAPIGTRPQSSASYMPARPSTSSLPPIPPTPPTQLNPAAASFNMLQLVKKTEDDKAEKAKRAAEKAAEKEARRAEKAEKKEEKEKKAKAEKAEKAARKDKDKHTASETGDARDATSPHYDSRMSRDTPSISTADVSEASPRESLERTVSHTASETAGSVGKESFMQKLTRKGSTTQFLTFSKKNALFSKNKTSDVPGTPDEADEDGGFLGLGRSTESVGNSPNIGTPKDKSSLLNWGSIKRIGKKDKSPSLHESIASEATGDEDDGVERA
ncbi:hypothetical protein EJ02DRAFT_131229 [Clathrospora elynae]|uniref:Fibronectin type-III domain-containing protein n=1 Tax=Clathrospora elynae TaxID=706981 RepID=A0A6A5SSF1_9PLEO|nr:hypothetical protein EJ02DRAFT_131229 [Clathrospora elynae]